jgi:hypothetical protein
MRWQVHGEDKPLLPQRPGEISSRTMTSPATVLEHLHHHGVDPLPFHRSHIPDHTHTHTRTHTRPQAHTHTPARARDTQCRPALLGVIQLRQPVTLVGQQDAHQGQHPIPKPMRDEEHNTRAQSIGHRTHTVCSDGRRAAYTRHVRGRA